MYAGKLYGYWDKCCCLDCFCFHFLNILDVCVFSNTDSFLVGVNKSYVIATSDLQLFIHASNLLPLLPTTLPYIGLKLHQF